MNDNCPQCGAKRYVDPPLPGKISRILCKHCAHAEHYVWCRQHDRICKWLNQCFPAKELYIQESFIKIIEKLDNMSERLQNLENMIKYLPGSAIYDSAKSEFETLK